MRGVLTVTMVDTMIIITLAIAEMTASMAPPIADTIAPFDCGQPRCFCEEGGRRTIVSV